MKITKKVLKGIYVFIFILAIVCLCGCQAKYVVTFTNGSDTTTVEVKEGSTVAVPSQPYKEEHEFVGWVDETGALFDFASAITKDVNLTARFQIDEDLAERFSVTFYTVDEEVFRNIKVFQDRTIDSFDGPKVEGGTFKYWELDGKEFNFNTQITKDLKVYAKYDFEKLHVTFNADGTKTVVDVEYGKTVERIANPTKEGKAFYYWQYEGEEFDFETAIKKDYELVALFGRKEEDIIHVEYDLGYECFNTKEDLRVAYYTDFYNFLIAQGYKNFEQYEIENVEDFLEFMDTFNYNGRNEMGTIGTAFGSYYVKKDVGGVLENQPETVFLGWCYKNNKYIDFIHHLEVFFEYWRTDEGYSQSDPNGNDFYAEPWASMVDTAKFFYFNGDTLQTRYNGIYKWFDSERVHEALDNIPGIGYVSLITEEKFADSIVLPTDLTRPGYVFAGWVDEQGSPITEVTKSMKVTAKWTEALAE